LKSQYVANSQARISPSLRSLNRQSGRTGLFVVKYIIKRIGLVNRLIVATITVFILAGCTVAGSGENPTLVATGVDEPGQVRVEMPHIHGLGFSEDGRQLIVPAHDGLRIFSDGEWHIPDVPAHDYMGYAAADNGFYSSGHPHPSSGLINPLGLVKSTDGGQTVTQLGFQGESDFHLMGVGYNSHAIYILNLAPNSKLSAGMHYSLDDGQTWQQSALQGISSQPTQIAVHPADTSIVALAMEGGLFLSDDYGNSFDPVGDAGPITAVVFSPGGEILQFGFNQLFAYDLATQAITPQPSPPIAEGDAIGYIAVNPIQPDTIAVATFYRDIYLSADGSQSWQPIAQAGKAVESAPTD
jgi:hypothetical protein